MVVIRILIIYTLIVVHHSLKGPFVQLSHNAQVKVFATSDLTHMTVLLKVKNLCFS